MSADLNNHQTCGSAGGSGRPAAACGTPDLTPDNGPRGKQQPGRGRPPPVPAGLSGLELSTAPVGCSPGGGEKVKGRRARCDGGNWEFGGGREIDAQGGTRAYKQVGITGPHRHRLRSSSRPGRGRGGGGERWTGEISEQAGLTSPRPSAHAAERAGNSPWARRAQTPPSLRGF